jgi:hypothetical protein
MHSQSKSAREKMPPDIKAKRYLMISFKQGGTLLLLALFSLPSRLHAAPAPFDIDLKELDQQKPAVSSKPEKSKVPKAKKVPAGIALAPQSSSADHPGYLRYTVKPGDHIFKILVARFGMSNEAAERLIPEIIRINNISNIKHLAVGQVLLIPGKEQQQRTAKATKKGKRPGRGEASEADAMLERASKLEAQGATGVPGTPGAPVAHPGRVATAPQAPAAAPAAVLTPSPTPPAPAPERLTVPPVAAASPQIPAPPAISPATWVCSVTERDPAKIVDAVLNALSISWSRNRIIQSAEGAPTAYSIRVDRYFEYKGKRYIVSIGENDPYSYTLTRLLEGAGYQALRLNGAEDFQEVSEKLLGLVGVAPDFGKHALQGGRDAAGFLIQPDDAGGKQVVITGETIDPRQKWLLAPGCGAR